MANQSLSSNDITITRKNMFKDRFESELKYTQNNTRRDQLHKIVNLLNETPKGTDIAEHIKVLDNITKLSYMKPWAKLQSFHKNKLLKDYCDEHFKENSKDAYDFVNENYEKKKMANKNIDYDPKKMKIISITGLIHEDNKFKINKND